MSFVYEKPEWHERAACRGVDVDVFFPPEIPGRPPVGGRTDGPIARAKRICAGCPVKAVCLEWALEREPDMRGDGVWGELTSAERRRIRLSQ